jgi:hypothetical protein
MRGRHTNVLMKINDGMFTQSGNNIVFDEELFYILNKGTTLVENGGSDKVRGIFSDLISFDISAVAKKPLIDRYGLLTTTPQSQFASRVYFSGDMTALSDKDPFVPGGNKGVMFVPVGTGGIEGFFRPEDPTTQVKQYELQAQDPHSFDPKLVPVLRSIYRDFREVLSNLKPFNMITIPKNGDGTEQQVVAFTWDGSQVTDMWFGKVDYSGAGNPTFRLYPIEDLGLADPAPTRESGGTFSRSKMIDKFGVAVDTNQTNWWQNVRGGDFTFTYNKPAKVPSANGQFTVYR